MDSQIDSQIAQTSLPSGFPVPRLPRSQRIAQVPCPVDGLMQLIGLDPVDYLPTYPARSRPVPRWIPSSAFTFPHPVLYTQRAVTCTSVHSCALPSSFTGARSARVRARAARRFLPFARGARVPTFTRVRLPARRRRSSSFPARARATQPAHVHLPNLQRARTRVRRALPHLPLRLPATRAARAARGALPTTCVRSNTRAHAHLAAFREFGAPPRAARVHHGRARRAAALRSATRRRRARARPPPRRAAGARGRRRAAGRSTRALLRSSQFGFVLQPSIHTFTAVPSCSDSFGFLPKFLWIPKLIRSFLRSGSFRADSPRLPS